LSKSASIRKFLAEIALRGGINIEALRHHRESAQATSIASGAIFLSD
jgi:hypothetical protein